MKQKQISFLVGLPRSGNTLFSSLMNQNPDVASTANSVVIDTMAAISNVKSDGLFKNYPDHASLDNVISSVIPTYYENWPQSHIIDRSPVTQPANYAFLKKYYPHDFKCIVLQRDLLEVLASYAKWFETVPGAFVNQYGWKTQEEKLLMLMNKDGFIARAVEAIYHAYSPELRDRCLFISYDELTSNPKSTIESVYNFLDIAPFEHNYGEVGELELNNVSYDDSEVGANMHTVRNKVSKEENPYLSTLPRSIVERFGHITFPPKDL